MRPTFPRALIVAVLALACFGCSTERHVTRPLVPTRPEPNSPANAVRLFAWGWNNRDLDAFTGLFSADFRFVFALGDSAGNLFRDHPVDRAEMLTMLRNLFIGGGSEPPATSITLTFDPILRSVSDDRPGKYTEWHKQVLTNVDFSIKTDQQEYRITGQARFYVVRGDSAVIPADLAAQGVGPDSTRWYIDQWNDGTLQNPGGTVASRAGLARTQPAHNYTWGTILALYR